MRIWHANRLAMANFLKTDAEPSLHYRPWELLPTDESRIKLQIEEAEAEVAKEIKEFEKRREQGQLVIEADTVQDEERQRSEGQENAVSASNNGDLEETLAQRGSSEAQPAPIESESERLAGGQQVSPVDGLAQHVEENFGTEGSRENVSDGKEEGDDNGDGEVVEAGEDAVIY